MGKQFRICVSADSEVYSRLLEIKHRLELDALKEGKVADVDWNRVLEYLLETGK